MYSQALLSRERNFLELNKELEEKVQGLMIEVDSIINKQMDVIKSPRRMRKKSREKPKEQRNSTNEAFSKNALNKEK